MTPRTRLYLPQAGAAFLEAEDEETLAVRRSLRLREGDVVSCFKGDEFDYFYRLEKNHPRYLALALLEKQPNRRNPQAETDVLIAATKGKTKDRIARDLPPLGITRLIFYESERSVAKPEPQQQARLQKIAIEACRQCGRSTIPQVEIFPAGLLDLWQSGRIATREKLVFWEQADPHPPQPCPPSHPWALIFGPEGGFAPEEIAFLKGQDATFASLGRFILRAELAAVVGAALIQKDRELFLHSGNEDARL